MKSDAKISNSSRVANCCILIGPWPPAVFSLVNLATVPAIYNFLAQDGVGSLLCETLEGLAPYGDQTSSSCGGLVAFGHQMGALRAPWTDTNTYIAQIQIHIGCKYKYNNQGQIHYVVVVRNIFGLG